MKKEKTVVLMSALLSCSFSVTAKENLPNIVLIMVDDVGYGDFGCYANTNHQTPNVDRMAANGVKLTDFHTNGALSSPTRAALMTGRYQQFNGVEGVITAANHRDYGLSTKAPTIAKLLKTAGYQTAIYGKWHLGYHPRYNPINHGFDEFAGYVSGNIDYFSHIDQEGYEDWWKNTEKKEESGYTTTLITDYAVKYIKKNADKPFFLYLPYEACHSPMQGPDDKAQRKIVNGKLQTIKGSRRDFPNIYKEMIESLDENIGRIIETIEKKGIQDNTLILFFSDNGGSKFSCNAPWSGGKGSLLEGGHRVSSVVYWPTRIKPGLESDATIMTMDIMPTLCELAGVSIKGIAHDGHSFWKTITNQKAMPKRTIFWRSGTEICARNGIWKLRIDRKNRQGTLVNLKNDPQEKNNLWNNHIDITERLMKEIEEWEKQFDKIEQFS